ncbi:MAG: tRNA (N(6)-L-threonylcarbamoyladenosine(37)-C(2))-methylthiotransferase MtaB [Lentimicrobiaceae bacterium]|nr:tRNA (N(6)-L-threonylcarbamoyladenosine(37)-C(2))-methylthiotransferase MtaB [Lentimicrobiaceae bacterium]MCB9023180.1 tRNA (N(6)-L-threonylcarbamoyladenosine(37)-C(2))-methylthiotransferase MtaB [Lentimicrobiaceae bacterium]MCO5265402.1 tRNA (N(6)-L-threonylcarbamoyladenosine(37)-C(2))-methylthiotransferase MtaB [Lentimicrobium sp.]HPG32777.1 tRNA (N(6)-L-threonylcarbamoyladenosine(37)-C(2))-methylthiotransferase MtaB [Lentimicrobium sp.]
MKKKKIAFHTFGCKLNFAETSAISRKFHEDEFESVDFKDEADIYVIHSCTVTAQAERKCKAAIRQAVKRNPSASIAVIGCFSQLKPDELRKMKGVDIVLGNSDKYRLADYIENLGEVQPASTDDKLKSSKVFEPGFSANDRTRSFFKVQDGCDYFCTFCAIPYARGRSRSATIAQTLEVAGQIATSEIKEIVLTGVNIGHFGIQHGETFLDLLKGLEKVEGIDRIRISSVEPELLNKDIIQLVADSEKFMPHFHIPLQSGTNRILELMKRKYKREVFADRVNTIHKLMPHACIAADVITGFPGETGDDFEDTYEFIKQLPISYLHVFSYSIRPGTKAALMDNQLSESEKQIRSRKLHQLSDIKKNEFYLANQHSIRSVLWESDYQDGFMHGFSDNYIRCKKPIDENAVNSVQIVRLSHPDQDGIYIIEPVI